MSTLRLLLSPTCTLPELLPCRRCLPCSCPCCCLPRGCSRCCCLPCCCSCCCCLPCCCPWLCCLQHCSSSLRSDLSRRPRGCRGCRGQGRVKRTTFVMFSSLVCNVHAVNKCEEQAIIKRERRNKGFQLFPSAHRTYSSQFVLIYTEFYCFQRFN